MKQKYPRTPHLPFSQGMTSDDKMLKSYDAMYGEQMIATEKADGENTSLYTDGFHARSLDSRHHVSRDWLAQFHATFANDIPQDWRICGENLYARHSIWYDDLPSYFLGFSIWNEGNVCLSWNDTIIYFDMLGITPVKELWRGEFSEAVLIDLANSLDTEKQEGFVVRPLRAFPLIQFQRMVAKFVRAGHVQTETHWAHQTVVPNLLRKGGPL